MTIEDFNSLPAQRQKEIIVDAQKVAEFKDDSVKYEVFKIDQFFVEVKVSFLKKYRKITKTFYPSDFPLLYSGKSFKSAIISTT